VSTFTWYFYFRFFLKTSEPHGWLDSENNT
jgi:hypothetical protein